MRRRLALPLLLLFACDDGGSADPEPNDPPDADALVEDLDATVSDAGDMLLPDRFRLMPQDAGEPDLGPPDVIRSIALTFNGLPPAMLGDRAGRYEGERRTFHWTVPPTGWTIDVDIEHGGEWVPPAAPPHLIWRALDQELERFVITDEVLEVSGWRVTEWGHRWSAQVTVGLPGREGMFHLQAAVEDEPENAVSERVTLEVGLMTPEADPFVEVDQWLVTFGRDRGALEVSRGEAGWTVRTTGEGDGTPDFEEALEALGLMGGDAAWRTAMIEKVKARLREHLRAFYMLDDPDPVRIALHFDSDPELPEDQSGWSRIAIGGEDPELGEGPQNFFGRADLDWHNRVANDNTGPNRGVFTTAFVRFVLGQPIILPLIEPYLPEGGEPFGSLPGDQAYLAPDFEPGGDVRSRQFAFVFDLSALVLASVTAHEIGHSLGLVKPGFPPEGMLAAVQGPWADSVLDGAHVDTPGFNIMQSGSSFSFGDLSSGPPRFDPANLAYLRRRLVVRP